MSQFRSCYTDDDIPSIIKSLFDLDVAVENKLESYDDQNFLIQATKCSDSAGHKTISTHGYVFKIINSEDSEKPEIIDAQTRIIVHLSQKGYPTPAPVLSIKKRYIENLTSDGVTYIARLFEFMPGKTLDKVPVTAQLCYEVGWFAGKMDQMLKSFTLSEEVSGSMKRKWNLSELPALKQNTGVIEVPEQKTVVDIVIDQFEKQVVQCSSSFSKGIIHSDFNDCNILVEERPSKICDTANKSFPDLISESKNAGETEKYRVSGIIDFGDATLSLYIFEVAIAIAYAMLNNHGIPPMVAAQNVLHGYLKHMHLSEWELKHLKLVICARFVQSLVIGNISFKQEPDNEYILIHAKRIWPVLKELWERSDTDVLAMFMNRC